MNPERVRTALLVSVIGTAVLGLLSWALHGLVGTAFDFAFCALGSYLSTWLVNRSSRTGYLANLAPAALITFSTFLFISVGHALEQVLVRRVAIDFEPVGKFVWATLATSWWLIPLCALTLRALNRRSATV